MKIPTHENPAVDVLAKALLAAPDLEELCAGRPPADLTWVRELVAAVRRFHEADP